MLELGCASARVKRAKWTPAPAARGNAPTVESKDPALAAALLRLAVHPSADAHEAVSREYSRLDLLEDAYAHVTAAATMEPRDARAYEMRARIWRDWGFPASGMADAARAVYYAPQSASAHNTWGTLLAGTGWLVDARREFNRARSLDPAGAYAQTNLCYVAFVSGDVRTAVAECRRALALDEGSMVARNNLALSLTAAGDYSAAEKEFLGAPDGMTGHYNAGVAYLAAGRYSDARASFEAVSLAHPLGRIARARAEQARALGASTLALGQRSVLTERRP
jgi:tetratricopeptide (TPR) repeat protein